MPDNLPAAPDPAFALPDHAIIELDGRDASGFAQAQFMNDVTTLAPGHWQWSGWLTPKGRVIALFALLRLGPDRLWLMLPDAMPAALADALQRYVFRSKLSLRVRDDLHVRGQFCAPQVAAGNRFSDEPQAGIELDLGGDGGPRRLVIGAASADSRAPDQRRWAAFDLEHGLPRLPPSQAEHWTPQQLSLERLHAFSIRKGCYPGQEIVARTHFLGKAKRGLMLIEAATPLAVGATLRAGDSLLGSLVASAETADRHFGLVVAPLARDAGALDVDGAPAHEAPLRDGLAR